MPRSRARKNPVEHFTQNIIEAAFGDPSSELSRFHQARCAGSYNVMGISLQQQQRNFDLQVQECEVLLQALTGALRLHLPVEEIQGVYEPGDEYAFYRDLSSLIQGATQEDFIVDAYLDEQVFNLYLSKVPNGVPVRILSNKIGTNVETVARMYGKKQAPQTASERRHSRPCDLSGPAWMGHWTVHQRRRAQETNLHD
jgi:hypothetical protein